MIRNIEIELSPYFDVTSHEKRVCAESIMEMIEKAGMLPPPDNTDVATGRILYCYYNDYDDDSGGRLVGLEYGYGEVDYNRSQLWEKE